MIPSSHNIFTPITGTDKYILLNLLTGNADILTADKAKEYTDGTYTDIDEYIEKGYLTEPETEQSLYRKAYANFIDERDRDEIQIFFVPWYSCNFGCSYCYQESYTNQYTVPDEPLIRSFFDYIGKEFAGRRKYVTIFGGEPLLPGEHHRTVLTSILDHAREAGLQVAIVTNGYYLEEYTELLSRYPIREIQVTLDGPTSIHDMRRPLKGGGPTFDRIVKGIDTVLSLGMTVNLRVVIDRENIGQLPALAQFAIAKEWTNKPNFKTQLGRNYELHTCQTDRTKLFSRLEMFRELYTLIEQHPEILEFHRPAFSVSKFLFDNGALPSPLFDSCPGTKTEWAFDASGYIYSCTATVGKQQESLGTFYPAITKKTGLIGEWEDRDVTTIEACQTCNLRLACGGGCASVAFNATGSLHTPDCRPVKDLIGMGISTYFKKELA